MACRAVAGDRCRVGVGTTNIGDMWLTPQVAKHRLDALTRRRRAQTVGILQHDLHGGASLCRSMLLERVEHLL